MASSPTPSNLESTPVSATQARLPKLSPEFIAQHYPANTKLLRVDLVHRHGERTPGNHRFNGISPKYWNLCTHGNQLHVDFTKAVHAHAPELASDKARDSNHQQLPWQSSLFEMAKYNPGASLGLDSLDSQHANDKSQLSVSTCAFSQLTDVGRESLTALGAHMRALYIDALGFLPATPRPGITGGPTDDFYLRTTAFNRSFASLQHMLGGMYPILPANTPLFRVNVRPPSRENLFPRFEFKNFAKVFAKRTKKSLEHYAEEYETMYQDMLKIPALGASLDTNFKSGEERVALDVWDTLSSMHSHGLPLPKEIDDAFIARVSQIASLEYMHSMLKSTELTRMHIGNIVHELASNIVHAVETDRGTLSDRQPSPKMGIYSGHDSTLGPLLSVFGDEFTSPSTQAPIEFMWPPYASSMRIELLKDTKTPCPATLPHWAGKLTDFSTDMAAALPESRVRPVNVPSSLYHWPPGRSGTAGSLNPRATRDYYVRV
ncbi:hypothetical protein EV174_005421, partial [Coemansia sp. RSA 2320]